MSPRSLHFVTLVGVLIWTFSIAAARADRLRVDFNSTGNNDFPRNTQEDFDAYVRQTTTTSTTWRLGTVTITVSPDLGIGLNTRMRPAVTNNITFTNALLLQDFIFNENATTTNSGLTVRVQGLVPNQSHQFTIWSYDFGSAGTRVSDWYANGVLVKDNYTFSGLTLPTSNTDYRFLFNAVADSNGEVLIVGRRDALSKDQNNNAATGVFLNGLEIDSIPSQAPPCDTIKHFKPGSNLFGWTGGYTFDEQNREIAALAEAGAKYARINVVWYAVEPNQKGSYDNGLLALYDNLMARLADYGIKAIFVTADTPYWASADPNKTNNVWSQKYKPTNFSDLADYYLFLLNRYASTGPHVFEIWNEQNHSTFWPSGVDATNYVSMLKTCYTAIKSADPNAIVLNGGLTDGGNTTNYIAEMYAAGAKPYFDVWSQHTYQRTPHYETIVPKVRDLMIANGDAAKKIWITECGWVTYTNTADASAVSYARQAHYLTNFFTRLASYPEVEVGIWYTSRSYDENSHEGSFGLMMPDFTKKPSYYAFLEWATSASRWCLPDTVSLATPSLLPNGNVRLQFAADSRYLYTVQSSDNFGSWQNVASNVAGTNNLFSFDAGNLPAASNRFFRVAWP